MSGEVKGKTAHGEMTVDQLAEVQPGMAAIMKEVGERYTAAYYAAKGGNWKLASYQISAVRTQFKIAKVTRPKYVEDLTNYDTEYLAPILKAIQAQSWEEFEKAFKQGEVGSDVYHDKRGFPHIRYVLPKEQPSNLYLGPPESFKRKTD